jgi:hypothetical protein
MAGVGVGTSTGPARITFAGPNPNPNTFPGISGGLRDGILLEFGYVLAPSNWHWHARLRRVTWSTLHSCLQHYYAYPH